MLNVGLQEQTNKSWNHGKHVKDFVISLEVARLSISITIYAEELLKPYALTIISFPDSWDEADSFPLYSQIIAYRKIQCNTLTLFFKT